MTTADWQAVKSLFSECLGVSAEARGEVLARAGVSEHIRAEAQRLLENLDRAGDSFLDAPEGFRRAFPLPGSLLREGDLLANRFEILRFVGSGGMGEVYTAHDRAVGEELAVKVLHPSHGMDGDGSARFRRELQLARRVTHSNVCRVFDLNRHTFPWGVVEFLTMEFIEGETLAQFLKEKRQLTAAQAQPVLRQILLGLEAAHRVGIVHRDLKPGNIMICGQPDADLRVVLMDFGLAKTTGHATEMHLTQPQNVLGTLAYMAPEQFSGGPVSSRTDFYAFGVIWREMVLGRADVSNQRDARSSATADAAVKSIPAAWAAGIDWCVNPDPEKRPASAAELTSFIDSPDTLPVSNRVRRYVGNRRREFLWGGAVAGTTAAGVALFPWASRLFYQDARLPEGTVALITPIVNATGEPKLDSVASGLTSLLRDQLSQSVHLNFIENGQLNNTLQRMSSPAGRTADANQLREAAWRLNAGMTLFGNVTRVGSDYSLSLQLETRGSEPGNPRTKQLRSFASPDADGLVKSVREASLWVRESVGEAASAISTFDRLPQDVTTKSWEALKFFSKAEELSANQDYEGALLEFESALQRDPQFTLAALRRADVLMTRSRQREGLKQWKAAIQMMDARPVTRREELNARGMFAFDGGDMTQADRYFKAWALEYPNDRRGFFYRVVPLIVQGHAQEAIQLLEHIVSNEPAFGSAYAQIVNAYIVLNQPAEARRWNQKLRDLGERERPDLKEAFVRYREGNWQGALEILRALQNSKSAPVAANAAMNEGLLLMDAGATVPAAQRMEQFLARGSKSEAVSEEAALRVILAWAHLKNGNRVAAVEAAKSALQLETGPLIVANAGSVFARLGDKPQTERALALCSDFMDVPNYRIAHHRIQGEMAASAGKQTEAIREFRAAAALEPRLAHRQYLGEALDPQTQECLELCGDILKFPWLGVRPPAIHSVGAVKFAVDALVETHPEDSNAALFRGAIKSIV